MNKNEVAIIDDGVNDKYFNLEIKHNVQINDNLEIIERINYDPYKKSHGSFCAAIIKKYYNEAIFVSIKILDDNLSCNTNKLVKSIEWCIENEIEVIHLSIGSTNFKDKHALKDIIEKAYLNNIIIVAASNNNGSITYPASFNKVLGVEAIPYEQNTKNSFKGDKRVTISEEQIIYNINSKNGVEILANGRHTLKTYYMGTNDITNNCNSYAAPLITAKILKIKNNLRLFSVSDLRNQLWKEAANYSENMNFYEAYNNLEWINNALIFSINSMQYLFSKYVFNVNKVVYIEHKNIKLIISEINKYLLDNNLENIDTIILDFNIVKFSDKSMVLKYLELVSLSNKNIVFINSLINYEYIFEQLKMYSRKVYCNMGQESRKLIKHEAEEPLIMVLCSNEEELYSILLSLGEKFKNNEYNAVIFSNSMKSIYYGCEFLSVEYCGDWEKLDIIVNDRMKVLNGDIGIIGIYNFKNRLDYIELLEKYFDIDIYIFANNSDKDEVLTRYECMLKKNNKKTILFSEYKNEKECMITEECIDKLYHDILFLYHD